MTMITLRQQVDDAIDGGDLQAAAGIASQMPEPQAFLKAMIDINAAMARHVKVPAHMLHTQEQHRMHKPQFELDAKEAKLTSYTPRRELHGEDPKPAASLAFAINLDASALAMFSPTLRSSFFYKASDEGRGDMVDKIADAADLRYPEIEKPFKWTKEIIGAELVIDHGLGGKSNIKLPSCDVDNFSIHPMQGGQAIVTFSVACHPDKKQSGDLAFLIGETVKITLDPPDVDMVEQAA